MRSILTMIILLSFTSLAISNPYVVAEPTDNETSFYILKVNDDPEITVATNPFLDWTLFHSVHDLKEGENEFTIQSADSFGVSEKVGFLLVMTIMSSFTRYEIKPDPLNDDPEYLAKFTDGLFVVDVVDGDVTEPPNAPPPESGGGGGGGCFIDTIFK